jgi:hypothetical protein
MPTTTNFLICIKIHALDIANLVWIWVCCFVRFLLQLYSPSELSRKSTALPLSHAIAGRISKTCKKAFNASHSSTRHPAMHYQKYEHNGSTHSKRKAWGKEKKASDQIPSPKHGLQESVSWWGRHWVELMVDSDKWYRMLCIFHVDMDIYC